MDVVRGPGGGLWWLDPQRADTSDTAVRVAAMSSGDDVALTTRRPRQGSQKLAGGRAKRHPRLPSPRIDLHPDRGA